jgi:hypothetical protein
MNEITIKASNCPQYHALIEQMKLNQLAKKLSDFIETMGPSLCS